MSTPELTVRRFHPGDESALNSLFNRVFQQDRSFAEWAWKFESNRIVTGLSFQLINVAEVDGEIVGQFPSMTARFKMQDQEIMLAQGVDTAVDARYRAKASVIVELARAHKAFLAESGILFGYGAPNRAHYPVGKWLLEYRDLCPLATFRLRLSWRHTLRRRFPWLPGLLVACAEAMITAFRRELTCSQRMSGFTIREVERFDASADDLWLRAKGQYGFLAIRDARYLNWRYADHPGRPYCILQAEVNGHMEGFIALRMSHDGTDRVGFIMDLFSVTDGGIRHGLLRSALAWFQRQGADYVLCRFVPGDSVIDSLQTLGFREHPAFPRLNVVYGPSEPANRLFPSVNDPREWHLTYGDFDGY